MALQKNIRESYLDFKLFGKVVLARKFNKRIPLFVYIMVTNRCNLKCIYCVTQCNKLKTKEIPINNIYRIVDELYELGTRYISIQGGESLLREDIELIIDYINNKGIITELVTNALLIKKKFEAVKKVKRLCISIDGYDEYNDLNRGKGTFKRIMQNINYLKKNSINIYRIESTFTKNNNNMENIRFLAELAKNLNCIFTPFTALITDYNISDKFRLTALQTRQELIDFWQKIKQLKKEGYLIHFNDNIIDNVARMASTVHEKYDNKTTKKLGLPICTFGRLSCYIDTNGAMYPCVPLFGLKGCNIYEYGVKKCWKLFDDLSCAYCFIGGFCSFSDINLKTIKHIAKVYLKHITKTKRCTTLT